MSSKNKEIVEKVNAAFAKGKSEEFLNFCAEDAEWQMVGDKSFKGKQSVREFLSSMEATGMEAPKFTVDAMVAEDDTVVCYGDMMMNEENGENAPYSYCDIYQFKTGKIIKLQSFIVKHKTEGGEQKAAA